MIIATRKHCGVKMEIVPCVGVTRSWVLKCRICKKYYDISKDTAERIVELKYKRLLRVKEEKRMAME